MFSTELDLIDHSINQFNSYVDKMSAVERSTVNQELNSIRIRLVNKTTTKEDIPLLTYCVAYRSKLIEAAMQMATLTGLTPYAESLRRLHRRFEEEARLARVELQEPDFSAILQKFTK